ncbi:MAG: hypothetical protein HY367_02700 [Candidatus Aenigmarchaeota archaeon]|nr:hypothetical protein [Candidatus Aenigmarchaeota archaeon]
MNERLGRFIKPHILKARAMAKQVKGEAEDVGALAAEKDKLARMLALLESEFKDGLITRNAYYELKENADKRLKSIGKRLR